MIPEPSLWGAREISRSDPSGVVHGEAGASRPLQPPVPGDVAHLRQLLSGQRDEVPTNPFWKPLREHALPSPPAAESSEERATVVVRLRLFEIGMVDDGPSPAVRAQELEDARGPAVGVDLGAEELRHDLVLCGTSDSPHESDSRMLPYRVSMPPPGQGHPELPEEPLLGGRITPGVVRVGDTVRRPTGPHSPFAHALLRHMERVRFAGAPRFLGIDEMGREILTYIEGDVPDNISPSFTDSQLVEAAELLRRYHDATAGSVLAGDEEVVCHNDVSPDNTVLVEGRPTAMIDFDMAAPGPRSRDLSLGAFLWLDVGWDSREPEEQRRRLRLWCDAYGLVERSSLIDDMKERIRETVIRRRSQGAEDVARWWDHQLAWVEQNEQALRV